MAPLPMDSRQWPLLRTCTTSGLTLAIVLTLGSIALAQQPTASPSGLGRAPSEAELRAWDISIGPDGAELPPGSGTAAQGALLFTQRGCANCHGPTGTEGPAIALVGGTVTRGTNYFPIAHWPFAPTIWSYIRRAMPYDRPGHLTPNEVYAVTAFLLHRNDIIAEDDVMDADSLPAVQMPHRADYTVPEPWVPGTPRGFKILP